MTESHCSKCKAPVVWIKMKNTGADMICDAQVQSGNGQRTIVTDEGVMIVKAKMDQVGREPHWGKCPFAQDFKKS